MLICSQIFTVSKIFNCLIFLNHGLHDKNNMKKCLHQWETIKYNRSDPCFTKVCGYKTDLLNKLLFALEKYSCDYEWAVSSLEI